MGLFSRRTIDRLLQENLRFMASDKLGLHVNHLNGKSEIQRLSTEWEVTVLNGLSRIGQVEHEPKFTGKACVDVLFRRQECSVLVDITTVSDRGLDDANPVGQLCDELIDIARQRGLNPDKFSVSVDGNWRELFLGGPKPRLFLPRPEESHSLIFNDNFRGFLRKLPASRGKTTFRVELQPNAGVTISYDPTQRFFSCRHLSYTVPFSLRSNPVYNRLGSKADQLTQSGFAGLKGIILCDAGCEM